VDDSLKDSAVDDTHLDFDAGFVWGASTASYQIEGAVAEDGRGPSIWDVFSHTPGRIKTGETGDVACDHYHRYAEDVDWLAKGGFRAYRFSTAWSRILPAGTGAINPKGLDFYDRLVDALIARGITPWICLYHWDLPQALQERGGWCNRDIAGWFADYARVVVARLKDRVAHWVMLNEPNVHAIFGHGVATHAPGLLGQANVAAALHHQNLAQGTAIAALRAEHPGLRLGTVLNLQPVRPASEREQDRAAAVRFDAMWNRAIVDPLFKGTYPAALERELAPLVHDGDLAIVRQRVDMLGLNYYSRMYIAHQPGQPFDAWFGPAPQHLARTAMDWPIEPQGLYEQLTELRDHYGNPAVYVTENGAAFDDVVEPDGTIADTKRIAYLHEHLAAARQAQRDGVALHGYFVWSLTDNFEWAEGAAKRFGVIRIDYATLRRTPKASLAWLGAVIQGCR
jgi:beta-glucosidase